MSVFTEFNSRPQLVSIGGKKKSKQEEVLVVNVLVHSEAFLTDIHSKVEPVASWRLASSRLSDNKDDV